ncbi:MAG: urea transporter [Bacteroidales bacterium]|nr:urea transporter [Bacteroidales bacterium]
MNNSTLNNFTVKTTSFAIIVLKGIGQIMLQENAATGFLFLIGIFYGSFAMGAAALLATVSGTATALLLNYNKSETDKGLYGFSAALVGVAVMLFLKSVILSWVFVIIGASLATIVQHFFIKRNLPVFTLPFVLVTWLIILLARSYFTDILVEPSAAVASTIDYFSFGFKGFGQVIFQDNLVAGLLFFVAVFISSPISALYGLTGGILSAIIAIQFVVPITDISIGLFSYNAVLCAIVFADTQVKAGIWALVSVLLSLFVSLFMAKFNMIPLTFPFVLAAFSTLFLKRIYSIRKKTFNF